MGPEKGGNAVVEFVRDAFVPSTELISTLVLCLTGVSQSTTKATQKAFVATREMLFFVSPRKLFVISKRH